MKNGKKKLVILLCAAAVLIGVGLYFLFSPGYFRELGDVTPVDASWSQETVILYEKEIFRNSYYEREESEDYWILKFEPSGKYYAHCYYFNKDNGKLNHFGYATDGDGRGCSHARDLYQKILLVYGRRDDSQYSHLEAYNGMLGGKRYHISVWVSDGTKNFSDESVIDITFWPGW